MEAAEIIRFRTPTWIRAVAGVACVIPLTGLALMLVWQGRTSTTLMLGVISLVASAGLADMMTIRVDLEPDALRIVKNFRTQVIPRVDIASVTWAAGSGVALTLTRGSFVSLPDVGNSQSRANSIRAWLERTQEAAPPAAPTGEG